MRSGRNNELTSIAGGLARKGKSQDAILAHLLQCPERNELPEGEVRNIARSVTKMEGQSKNGKSIGGSGGRKGLSSYPATDSAKAKKRWDRARSAWNSQMKAPSSLVADWLKRDIPLPPGMDAQAAMKHLGGLCGFEKTNDRDVGKKRPAILIPFRTVAGELTGSFKFRFIEPKESWPEIEDDDGEEDEALKSKSLGPVCLLNAHRLTEYAKDPAKPVFVFAGEKDLISGLLRGLRAVAVAGEGIKKLVAEEVEALRQIESVIVCYDNDEAGLKAAPSFARVLGKHDVKATWLPPSDMWQGKDLTDWLRGGLTANALLKFASENCREAEGAETSSSSQPENQVQLLLRIVKGVEPILGLDGRAYIRLPAHNDQPVLPIDAGGFRDWLTIKLFDRYGTIPSSESIKKVVGLLSARARFAGKPKPVFIRVMTGPEGHLIDLAGPGSECVSIGPGGWQIQKTNLAVYRRSASMLPLPDPLAGGSLRLLRKFVNVESEDAWRLIVAWLVAALYAQGPYPILILTGQQGSAKSTLARILRSLVDPSIAPIRSLPTEERDLFVSAHNSWVLSFDNVSRIQDWLSDGLCRICSGGGFAKRKNYSDDEEIIFDVQRPIILNGITIPTRRQDLLDRSIIVQLNPIDGAGRRTEQELWEEFESVRPLIFGALLDALCQAQRDLGATKLKSASRMADFDRLIVAAEPALPWKPGEFEEAYRRNRRGTIEQAVEDDTVANAIREFMDGRAEWAGIATELRDELKKVCGYGAGIPKDPRRLSMAITRWITPLLTLGIRIERDRKSKRRIIKIINLASSCVTCVTAKDDGPENAEIIEVEDGNPHDATGDAPTSDSKRASPVASSSGAPGLAGPELPKGCKPTGYEAEK